MIIASLVDLALRRRAAEQCALPPRQIHGDRRCRQRIVPLCDCGVRLYDKSREVGICWRCRKAGKNRARRLAR